MARVLLLDDEPTIRFVISEVLSDAGFEPVVVQSGQQALEMLRAKTSVDAMIIDLVMPEMTGKELLRQVRAVPAWSAIPVVLMTGAVYGSDVFPPAESYQAVLQKPFKLRDLVRTVEQLLDKRPVGLAQA